MPQTNESEPVSRRDFLAVGGSVAAVAAAAITAGALTPRSAAAQTSTAPQTGNPPGTATPPPPPATTPRGVPLPALRLEPITQPTEREEEKAPTAVPPDRRIGFAIVGLGRLSLEQILPAFAQSKRCKPVALVSGDRNKALQVAEQYGIKPTSVYDYQTYDTIRSNPEVDVIYIVLPNSMHAEYTIRGAAAGKHILCEKPMATSAHDCEQMIDACKKANRKLMIAYRIQYEPHNRAVRKMIETGELGKVKLIDATNGQNQGGDLKQWRLSKALAGGGPLPDVGLYCLNTLRFITGEEPVEIMGAYVHQPKDDPRFTSVEETTAWSMRFPSGIIATCSSSYGIHEARRYTVFASDAHADMDPAFSYTNLRQKVSRKSSADPKAEALEERIYAPKNHFALEMDHMAECVVSDKTPFTPGEEGLQDQRIMERIYQAAKEGKSLDLPRIERRDAFRGTIPTEDS